MTIFPKSRLFPQPARRLGERADERGAASRSRWLRSVTPVPRSTCCGPIPGVHDPAKLGPEHVMLINRRLQNSGTTSKTIGNPDLPEDVLALCYFQRHQRRPQHDPRGLRLQGRDRYRQAQFHPTEALAILSAARQETDPLLRWAPLVMHTPAAGSVSCWARPRLPSNSATGFGVWRSKKGVPRRAVNSDAEGAREDGRVGADRSGGGGAVGRCRGDCPVATV